IAEDAVANNDPIHSAAVRRWLAARCVAFESSSALLQRMDGRAPKGLIHRSPRRTNEILFEVHNADAAGIRSAASAAQNVWQRWRRIPLSVRQQILDSLAHRLTGKADELSRQIALEIGKPIRHAREEIHRAAANIRDVIRRAASLSAP